MILSFLRDEDNERMKRCQGKKEKKEWEWSFVLSSTGGCVMKKDRDGGYG